MVCLLAAPCVQLFVSAGNGWPHNALRHHWFMAISCHFWDCTALLVTSLTHVIGAIASVQTFAFTFFKVGIQLAFGTILSKTTFRTNIGGGLGQGSIRKNLGPLLISATVEAGDWKIGTQHEFRFTLPNTSFRAKLGRVWIRRVPLTSHYDNDATVYYTCHQKLTGTQISLLSGIKQKI